ncbi:hypothetical protein [Staphylococcus lutrae]|uniref:DUF3784 domain-containing protein n=1 Tax=Staphylococcus lutrae TaxID=155085 RepID=A0AAC9RP24_9STAP|nr:hypothetical protein [Staphylococcus lutrae]ARJ50826.1 hypothetical protein B5P37_05575 [Staphylococcus lutrae]PNZ36818.1 hypothetical protein CD134_07405 [Staphylococcus lutrae]
MRYAVGISFAILILLTGAWLIIFNRKQPIISFFPNHARTNVLIGQSFLILSLIYLIIVLLLPIQISGMLLLYVGLSVLDLIIVYILLKVAVIK